tara:strand:- start:182 stop:316 length:135 start_codon:yes stop_codon:yes gene_type:complete
LNIILYIDPGTGMIILQFIISLFAGIAIFFKSIKKKIKDFFKKK